MYQRHQRKVTSQMVGPSLWHLPQATWTDKLSHPLCCSHLASSGRNHRLITIAGCIIPHDFRPALVHVWRLYLHGDADWVMCAPRRAAPSTGAWPCPRNCSLHGAAFMAMAASRKSPLTTKVDRKTGLRECYQHASD
jgi:hypothetical protein